MKQRDPLVCQYMEHVSRQVVEEHLNILRQYIRHREGIYALYRDGKLYYVGLASNLTGRIKQHLRDKHGQAWDRFSVYLTIGDEHMKELESLLLRISKPQGNKQSGRFHKAENLHRRFWAEIKRWQQSQLRVCQGRPLPSQSDDSEQSKLLSCLTGRRLPMKIRGHRHGRTFKARVLKNGTISYQGKRHPSLSAAARSALAISACNGWAFWRFEEAPGYWRQMGELRGAFLGR